MRYPSGLFLLLLSALAADLLSGVRPAHAQTEAERSPTDQREDAVRLARAGNMTEALARLRAMLARGIDDGGLVAMDLVTLLQQDRKPAEAIAVFEQARSADPPDYALLAATRAYRDLHRYDEAAQLARRGQQRFPDQSVWPILLSLVLSDAGKPEEALAILRQPAAAAADPVERLSAEGYAWRRAGDLQKALKAYAAALAYAPADAGLRAEAAAVLRQSGGPFGAAAVAGHPTLATEADEAASMVQWGAQLRDESRPAQRFDGTDAALARIDALLQALPPPPAEAALRRRLRLDRLVALRDRRRPQQVIDEATALRAEGPLPPYAEEAYADALLDQRHPEDAREAYRRVLAQNPKDVLARYGVFYASVELDDYRTAYATIDDLAADEPVWRVYNDSPSPHPNTGHAYAQVTAAQARLYGNQLADAWERISRIAQAAPADPHARLAASQVANARGWQRRADSEAEIAASLAPDDLGARIALVEVEIANHRFARAREMTKELTALYPEDPGVRRLARDLDAKLRWVLELEAMPGNSNGGGANASGQTLTLQGRLSTPPIADNWRAFALADYANAHPPEGFAQRTRAGLGLEWSNAVVSATAFPTQSWGTLSKAGGGATVDWRITDELHLALAGEIYSWDTPLRAQLYGISANEISAKALYRWHESRTASLSFAYLPFTDGNQRFTGGATYKEAVITLPGFWLSGMAEAFASSNSRLNAPYYNPARDLSVTGGLSAEHILWRRYDNSLLQALTVDGGLYSEYGYGNNWIGTVRYEHRWRFDPLTEFHYGINLMRRVYDGSVENGWLLTLGLAQRI